MADTPVILSFDTSGPYCVGAVLIGERIAATSDMAMARGQAEALMPMLDDLLLDAGIDWGALGAIGVGTGPGNFTGIRISVSAARGLAMGLGIPAHGVTNFDAMGVGQDAPIAAIIPAPRGQFYVQTTAANGMVEQAVVADASGLADFNGMNVIAPDDFAAELHAATGIRSTPPQYSIAHGIALVAHARLGTGEARPPRPCYLRSADAASPRDLPPRILT